MKPMSDAHLAPAYVQHWQFKSWCVAARCLSLVRRLQHAGSSAYSVISVSGDVATICACTHHWPCCMLCIDSEQNSSEIQSMNDCHSGKLPGFLQGSPTPIFNTSVLLHGSLWFALGSCSSILQGITRQLPSLRAFICCWVFIVWCCHSMLHPPC